MKRMILSLALLTAMPAVLAETIDESADVHPRGEVEPLESQLLRPALVKLEPVVAGPNAVIDPAGTLGGAHSRVFSTGFNDA